MLELHGYKRHCTIHSPIHSPIHCPIHSPIHSPIHCPIHCPIHYLMLLANGWLMVGRWWYIRNLYPGKCIISLLMRQSFSIIDHFSCWYVSVGMYVCLCVCIRQNPVSGWIAFYTISIHFVSNNSRLAYHIKQARYVGTYLLHGHILWTHRGRPLLLG